MATKNMIELATVMTGELEESIVQKSVTGFFADNILRAKFVGAKTVIIPEAHMSGLGDYDRDTGFAKGSVTISNTPFTLSMDRGRQFMIDAEDADESGIADLAGKLLRNYSKEYIVPEIDAYVLSKVAGYAVGKGQTVSVPDGGTFSDSVYSMIMQGATAAQNELGFDEDLVVFVNAEGMAALETSPEIQRSLSVGEFERGGVSVKVKTLNGMPILPVSSARMHTAFEFYNGVDTGEEQGGFAPTSSASKIGILIVPKDAVSLVKKAERIRYFAPDENQQADAHRFDFRMYYDAFVRNARGKGIYAYVY